jgi:hypothetical protein
MLEAERQFRRIIGYTDLAKLIAAIDRHHQPAPPDPDRQETATLTTA